MKWSRAWAFALILVVGCQPWSHDRRIDSVGLGEFVGVVQRFIAADTAGRASDAIALVLPLGADVPYCELATDGYQVISGVALGPAIEKGDTGFVIVRYRVLGVANSEDPHLMGPRYWRFHADVHTEVDTFTVLRDSTGHLGIGCGPRIPPNHLGIEAWRENVSLLDAPSRRMWDSVTKTVPATPSGSWRPTAE